MEVIYNKSGIPLTAYGSSAYINTVNVPRAAAANKDPVESNPIRPLWYYMEIGGYKVSPWGTNNNFPLIADELINRIGVLNTGLRFIRNVILGQGIFPCRVKGFDNDGNEILEVINDLAVESFCSSRMVRRYMEKATRDFLKYGIAFPELIPNAGGDKIVGVNAINALHSRFTIANDLGEIDNCIVSGWWSSRDLLPIGIDHQRDEGNYSYIPTDPSQYKIIPVLSEYDPMEDLNRRRLGRSFGKGTLIYPMRDSWSNKDYYSAPAWWPTKEAGWLEIAMLIPQFLKKAYENQISWKWHVKIPYAFWDRKFPETEFKTKDERKEAIDKYLDDLERNLCAPENSNKTIITGFEIGPGGKAEEQWVIEALDNKYTGIDQLVTSAAANSEILFSLMINPNVLGAGMPGGTYAGNQGGSNIREAFLVNIANSWPERQNLLDPLECYLEFNGVKDVELRFRNTILTTLDTGAGTKKQLS
jgi:hypothetical protein